MHCYCFNKLIELKTDVIDVSFKDVSPNKDDNTKYCQDWLVVYGFSQTLVYTTSVITVTLNMIITYIIRFFGEYEGHHTQNDKTTVTFYRITLLLFINTSIITLLVNMDLYADGTKNLLTFLNILNGEYPDFDSAWYAQVGTSLSFTLLLGIFTPHGSYFFFAFLKVFRRCLDRGCRSWDNIKIPKDELENEGDINVHTKLYIQDDINELYTGDEIAAYYVYATSYSYLLSVLTYSTGLPMLYPFACIFFFMYYWVYKTLLIKFYARSRSFNESIPMVSTTFFTLGVILHLLMGALMISNSNILTTSSVIKSFKDSGEEVVRYVIQRMNSFGIASTFFAFSIILCVLICIKNCCFGAVQNCCARCCEATKSCLCCKLDPSLNHEVSSNIYDEMRPNYLRSLYIKA